MAGLVSVVGLVVAVKTFMDACGSGTMVLGFILLMNMIAANSPVADERLLYSTHQTKGFLGDVSSPTRPSLSPSPPFLTNALESQDTRVPQQVIPQSHHESFTPSNLNAKESQPLSTPSLPPSQLALRSFPQFEKAKLSIDWNEAQIKSANQKTLLPTPLISQMQPQLNGSRPSAFERSTVPQLSSTKEAQNVQGSESTATTMTRVPGEPMNPLDFSDTPSDEAYHLDRVVLYPTMGTIQQENQPRPSGSTMTKSKPMDILPNAHEILSPSYYVPFISPYLTSELTEAPPEDFYPTNTIDFDWGSGDFLETIAFLNPEDDDNSLVTKVPDTYDQEDNREHYNTAFPSRVGTSLSSLHHLNSVLPTSSLMIEYSTHLPLTSVDHSSLSPVHTTIGHILEVTPTISTELIESSESMDWQDTYSIQPTDVLLPDMNSLEYYTTQLTKENSGSVREVEQRGNVTLLSTSSFDTRPTSSISNHRSVTEQDFDHDLSGFEPQGKTVILGTTEIFNSSKPYLHHSDVTTPFLEPSSSIWATHMLTTDWFLGTHTVSPHSSVVIRPSPLDLLPDDVVSTLSLTDVQWFVTEVLNPTSILTATAASSGPTEHLRPSTEQAINITSGSSNATVLPPVMLGDQGVTKDEFDNPDTMTLIPTNSDANTTSPNTTFPNASASSHQTVNVTSVMGGEWQTTTLTSTQYLCNPEKPEYLVKIGLPSGAKVEHVTSEVEEILKREFNKSVALQVVDLPPKFVFRVVSDPVVYTAISVINALRRSGRHFLPLSPHWMTQDNKYQVHTVLQFVPVQVDVRFCNFSEHIERGLTMAFTEVCLRSKVSTNFTVHIINITMAVPKNQQQLGRYPVDITFTVHSPQGYLLGSEVSTALMKLTKVEFSYYMGFPVQQIAEPFHYPKLNTSQFLRSSWVRTVLLGVLDSEVGQRTFQANIERRMAMLLGEAMGSVRRVKRATNVGNNSIQVVSVNRPVGMDNPLEVVYFVERPDGQRVPAVEMASILNSLDVQKAAIILGYRVEGVLAQPVEKVPSLPSDTENTNMWIIIGVVIPLLVVIIIIAILYLKLCRTDKLEFQPDAMTSIQQRQKSATSQSPAHQSHQHESGIECSEEEEEWTYEEEEVEYEDIEEEEISVKSQKGTRTLKSKDSTSSEEEEEEEENVKEESETFEKNLVKAKDKSWQEKMATQKRTEEMKKEERMRVFPKGRRAKQELQAPSVKGFDFAKLHLGQQNKDDVIVVQESISAAPLNISDKEGPSPSQNGDVPTPISKNSASSTKASRSFRRRERISPSDGDSMVSDRSSGRESTEENLRAQATPSDSKQTRKIPINVLNGKNRIGPPPANGLNEQMSSASIFEHVDRMSRATDVSRRLPNKVQLIALQPMTVPPLLSHTDTGKLSETSKFNKEIQVAMRQKSEMEHHRNKIRLRAKRKGHYDFPAMDDIDLAGAKEQDHIYHKAQMQMDKILDRNAQIPSIFKEPQKSARGKSSPKQKMKDPLNGGGMTDADKDQLITEDSEAVYRKCPGVNNVAYVSDADQASGMPHRSPSPTDEVFLGPACSPPGHAPPPPPYMPPQPSIEEARQQMHSLLDDAFALVSPTSQGSSAGVTLPGVIANSSDSRLWGPSYQGLGPYTGRFSNLSVSPPLVQGLISRQDRALSYLPPGEMAVPGEQLDGLYPSRGLYTDELPTSARPRPVGGTTDSPLFQRLSLATVRRIKFRGRSKPQQTDSGVDQSATGRRDVVKATSAQLHHLTQVGLSGRMNGYPAGVRGYPGLNGNISWNDYHEEPYCGALPDNSVMARSDLRELSAPPAHPDLGAGYLSAPLTLDVSPPTQSSASLIKAIREELLRLSQKQGFHS
ncbi:UPF0606 protein KIAA1549 isoform X2 [Corythoichthys intestinalis]|uniref:UPF0606 protein KIAA1549 isoform X2 n=1 Tax=Corythoichthys intestinalis TaxID=161448 RepID=UPI0025A501C6|nr:UPF0606 protein KIAA1549 isoform X2 [Corythoichthys intestinalis]